MDMMNKNVLGVILICLGLLLVFPMIPKIIIFILGFYLIFLGIRMLKGRDSTFYSYHSKTYRGDYFDVDSDDKTKK